MTRTFAALLVALLATVGTTMAAAGSPAGEPLRVLASVPVRGEGIGLALDGRSLWVSATSEGTIARLDARTGKQLARFRLNRLDRRAFGAGPLAVTRDAIFIAAPVSVDDDPAVPPSSGWIGRLDKRSGKLRVTFVHGDPPVAIAIGAAGIWVSGGSTLRHLDGRSGRVLASVSLGRQLGALAVGDDSLWVDAPHEGTVLRLDARTLKVVRSVRVGRTTSAGSLALGTRLWAVTDGVVVAVDPLRARVTEWVRLALPNAVAVDGDAAWVYTQNGLYSVARNGRATQRLALPPRGLGSLVVHRGTIWLNDEVAKVLRRIG